MKKYYRFLIIFLVLSCWIPHVASAQVVNVPDRNLAAAVRDALGLAPNAVITEQVLQRLTVLDTENVNDFTGLEHATRLTELTVFSHGVTDLTPLAQLTNLTTLDLIGFGISDITPLARLTNLTSLDLTGSAIDNVTSLTRLRNLTSLGLFECGIDNRDLIVIAKLTNLTALGLGFNTISDVSPLANLTNLTWLSLIFNEISDVSPLANLTNLTWLALRDNPITDTSPLANLPKLRDLDVKITAPPTTPVEVKPTPEPPVDSELIPDPPRETGLIRDPNLAAAVRETLGLAPNVLITEQTIQSLQTLDAGARQITNLTGLEHATQLEALTLSDNQIKYLKPLAGLTQLKVLYLDKNQISDVTPLVDLTQLVELTLGENKIRYISTLAGLTGLEHLVLSDNKIGNVTSLADLTRLKELRLAENNISNVSPLAKLVNLEKLLLAKNPIEDTSPLASLTKLVEVDIEITALPKDLIPDANLAGTIRETLGLAPNAPITEQAMRRLTTLDASGRRITNLTGLEYAVQLTGLHLQENQIGNISPLRGLKKLSSLELWNNQIQDISPLRGLTNLTELYLNDNQISDITPIAGLTKLRELGLGQNRPKISDITPLQGLTKIVWLNLYDGRIRDISPLAELTRLESLYLEQNRISDVSPLAGLTRLKDLRLAENNVGDVSPLAGLVNLEKLWLVGNPITDTSSLVSLTKLVEVDIDISADEPVDVLIYTGSTWWITRPAARAEAETTKSLLQAANIQARITGNENYVKQWMLQTTSDGAVNVLILYGVIPNAIYPAGNTLPDGSIAENWIETPDGNTILNHADYFGWTTTDNSSEIETNEFGTLQSLMDNPNIFISIDRDNTPMFVTIDGKALTPSLVNFQSDRAFPLDQLQGKWYAEKTFASNTGDDRATLADPVILRDGNRGRLAIVHQTFAEDNPKAEVAAEIIINHLLIEPIQAMVSVSPSQVPSPAVGEQLTFSLNITDGENVAGYQATLAYDTSALRYVSGVKGDYLSQEAFFVPPVAAGNTLTFAGTSQSGERDGAGTLAIITFEVVAAKVSTVTVSNVLLSDSAGVGSRPSVEAAEITAPLRAAEDINADGIVNIQDMVLVATNFGQAGENAADVNGDRVVDIRDLVKVAGAFGKAAAAPALNSQILEMFTATDVRNWLTEAHSLNVTDITSHRGIRFLEQLLATLIPKESALLSNYPNPFNPETWIPYQLAKPADVSVTIYDVRGTVIRHLELGHQAAGVYHNRSRAAYWDGKNALGEPVASGVYFYTLTAGDFTATRKMLIRK